MCRIGVRYVALMQAKSVMGDEQVLAVRVECNAPRRRDDLHKGGELSPPTALSPNPHGKHFTSVVRSTAELIATLATSIVIRVDQQCGSSDLLPKPHMPDIRCLSSKAEQAGLSAIHGGWSVQKAYIV